MPTYIYERSDGSRFEHFQSMSADPLTVCPETDLECRRVIVNTSMIHLKGSGWAGKDVAAENRVMTEKRKHGKLYTTLSDYKPDVERTVNRLNRPDLL
jgi:putative FmdB family regulatory protein